MVRVENNDPSAIMKILRNLIFLIVSGIEDVFEQDTTPMSDLEDPLSVHAIPDGVENASTKESIKSLELTYHKKETGTDTASWKRVQRALKNWLLPTIPL